jgi:hypothetical protein
MTWTMKETQPSDLENLSTDELWDLRERVTKFLSARISEKNSELERMLAQVEAREAV